MEESICLVVYYGKAVLNLSSSFSLFSVYFCYSTFPFPDAAARNSNGFRNGFFQWHDDVLCFFFYFCYIFICPFHNSENSLFILSCAQERQFVWLSKHKHISLIYYSNKYWRIPAFYLAQVTTKTAKTKQSPSSPAEEQDWGIPGLLLSSSLSTLI